MKHFVFLSVLITVLAMLPCCNSDFAPSFEEEGNEQQDPKITSFEHKYLKSKYRRVFRSTGLNAGIRLIGYTTIQYYGEDQNTAQQIWQACRTDIDNDGSIYVGDGFARIYYPLREAIIECDGQTFVADSTGYISGLQMNSISNIVINGRQATTKSIETFFSNGFTPSVEYADENTYIFDMGFAKFCQPTKINIRRRITLSEGDSDGAVSCTQNHYPYSNCTVAFGIHSSTNCPIHFDRCMDYNGYLSTCTGNHLFFLGSDCNKAMEMGHCWNEVMN